MALEISKQHTALLAMDFENDIVHPEGAFKDFGFAQMVADNSVLDKTSQLLAAARGAGVSIIYVSVKFRPGYPERAANAGLWQGLHGANALIEGTWGAPIDARRRRTSCNQTRGFSLHSVRPRANPTQQPYRNFNLGWRRHQFCGRRYCPTGLRPRLQHHCGRGLLCLDEPRGPRSFSQYSSAISMYCIQPRRSNGCP